MREHRVVTRLQRCPSGPAYLRDKLLEFDAMVEPLAGYVDYEDFLEAERDSDTKHEWLDGVIYAMGGGSLEHSRLAGNAHTVLKTQLSGCEVFQSDAMLYVRASELSTYADITVVCGPVRSQKVERNGRVIGEALLNPTIIAEVVSDSTEDYDRGEKFGYYMTIPSLQEYVLIAQREAKVEVFRRPERGKWKHAVARAGETIDIGGRPISVDAIYRKASSNA